MALFTCEICRKDFKRKKAGKRPIRFCSQKCYNAWRKIAKVGGFEAGHVPWNKGLKGIHLSPKTEFKKGHRPSIKCEVGTVRIRRFKRDNKKRAFIKIKEPNIWVLRCHYVWEKAYGKIPKGLLIHHIDRNTLNDDIKNLALVNRAIHMNEHRPEFEDKRRARAIQAQKRRWGNYLKSRPSA